MPSLDHQSCLGLRSLVAARKVQEMPAGMLVAVPMLLVVQIVAVVLVVCPTGPRAEEVVPRMDLKDC